MKGLLRKDFYIMFRHCRMVILAALLIAGLVASKESNFFLLLYPAMLVSLLTVSLVAYDERDRWDVYCGTLPYTKLQLVASKYLIGLINSSVAILLTLLMYLLRMLRENNFSIDELAAVFFLLAIASFLAPALVLPFIYRYGTEKGRLVYYIVLIMFCGLAGGLSDRLTALVNSAGSGMSGIFAVCSLLLYVLSCFLSVKFYQKREIA